MRRTLSALALILALGAIGQGCAPVPLPHYAAYPPKRVEELLNDSENLRMVGALDEKKDLTSLGRVLLQLPIEVQMGRLLLFGSSVRRRNR